ncbi:MAG: D-alanine--D-alanine ligase [Sphingomonadaceae bacterium]|uniref:D-alanine--D-alanine ligase n=1 Tax=Thermaurantiacus sp. TaxID=2820283 RepID=UPI00298F0105|nr:D-alanine--D-alanine ligase [Thermaurantiacus sp.]MCS6986921.1 D-alanine--D-alanine ligase [Sphingomonadaceae bacterium]MDW8415479.1 D-alanine--D-alanine ligase [Thermaurantiacus sp.]
MRVAVLMGGWSAERAISLVSGAGVAQALRSLGHEAIEIDMGPDPSFGPDLPRRLLAVRPDVVFNALHGSPGEDGSVQGLLEILGLPYTHSGVTASAIAIDKQRTKDLLAPLGMPVAQGCVVDRARLFAGEPLPRPYVLKPPAEGSSVGVAILMPGDPPPAPDRPGPWQRWSRLMAEAYVPGRELTVAVLEGTTGAEVLGVTELKPCTGFYDYEAKYTAGRTVHVCPAEVPHDVAQRLGELALLAHRALGCRGVSRSDFRWDDARGLAGLVFLEINTQPGMTPLSLVPEQAAARGLSYEAVVERLLQAALAERAA